MGKPNQGHYSLILMAKQHGKYCFTCTDGVLALLACSICNDLDYSKINFVIFLQFIFN